MKSGFGIWEGDGKPLEHWLCLLRLYKFGIVNDIFSIAVGFNHEDFYFQVF